MTKILVNPTHILDHLSHPVVQFLSSNPLELPCTEDKVYFTAPLKRDPIGNVPKSSGWRFLVFNNMGLDSIAP